jgi:hypothetical protein
MHIVDRAVLREVSWRVGVEHRERLMAMLMDEYGLDRRPLLKNVYRQVISDYQEVRLLEEALPRNRFAETRVVDGRPVITINSMTTRMPKIAHPDRVKHVSAWHESAHVLLDVGWRPAYWVEGLPIGLGGWTPSPILCVRDANGRPVSSVREFIAEAVGIAAAVADADLKVGSAYLNFLEYTSWGGDPDGVGWHLLCQVSASIGVNVSVLARYFEQHGLCRRVTRAGRFHLEGVKRPFRGFVCLEPESASLRSIA